MNSEFNSELSLYLKNGTPLSKPLNHLPHFVTANKISLSVFKNNNRFSIIKISNIIDNIQFIKKLSIVVKKHEIDVSTLDKETKGFLFSLFEYKKNIYKKISNILECPIENVYFELAKNLEDKIAIQHDKEHSEGYFPFREVLKNISQ